MRKLEDIVSDVTRLAQEAYELGSAEGAAKLRAELAAILIPQEASSRGGVVLGVLATTEVADTGHVVVEKARMGTVKPGIIRLINETPTGLTQDEIIEKTGFKSNSVRGTLHTIFTEGLVERRSGRYYPKSPAPNIQPNDEGVVDSSNAFGPPPPFET